MKVYLDGNATPSFIVELDVSNRTTDSLGNQSQHENRPASAIPGP